MKNKYGLIIILLFTAIACNDKFLEKYPLDQINDATFWKSSDDIALYANQFYQDLKPQNPNTNSAWVLENPTDNNASESRSLYSWNEATVPTTGGGWGKADWAKIRSCNYALDHIATMKKDVLELQYEAEIRFFKAFYYFLKVKTFGDVPWLEHALQTDSEDLLRARDSRKTVIANMLKDLDFAVTNLPEKSGADRLTKYAALALKSEVCLYEGTFRKYHNLGDDAAMLREAVTASESIMSSGLFSVYSTGKPAEDYFNLFIQDELKGNSEGIMVQRYIKGLRTQSHVRLSNETHAGYTEDFVQTYLCSDGLPISLSPLYKGDAVFGDQFINRDPRMQQSVYNSDRPYSIYQDGTKYYKPMPEFSSLRSFTSYFFLKGFNPDIRYNETADFGIIDDFIFRYSKTLLEYAEAKAELNECTQADLDKSLNLLRDRVNMPHLTVAVGFVDPNWPKWEVPVTPLINEIRRERRIELADEGYRWDDLMRWKAGKLLNNAKTVLGARDPATGQYRVLYPGFTRVWNDRLYLHPIPTQELVLNPKLTQNPGW